MDFNRHKLFTLGIVLLWLGFQFRSVDSFILNDRASRFLAENMPSTGDSATASAVFVPNTPAVMHRAVQPPKWLGWSLMSVGFVLVCHSFAMRKPS